MQFYERLAAGVGPGATPPQQQKTLLFPSNSHATAATPGLKRKVCPAFRTTTDWTRLQRKVLPKFLLVLDDEIGVLLLKSLARLQPQGVDGATHGSTAGLSAAGETSSEPQDQQLQQRKERQTAKHQLIPPQRLTAAHIPTSITGALTFRHKAAATAVAPAAAAVAASGAKIAGDAGTVSRGFVSAADERAQFELMLSAVYAAFQHKLQHWQVRRLVKALGYAAQLQLYHHGFLQVSLWCSQLLLACFYRAQ